jgi:TolB-like protein
VRGDIPRGDADTVYELFVGELAVSGSVKVVDRNSFDTTAALGTALNADWVIQGTMQKLGGRLLIIASILDIKSLKMMGVADMRVNGIDEVYDKMGDFVAQTIQTIRGGGGAVRE